MGCVVSLRFKKNYELFGFFFFKCVCNWTISLSELLRKICFLLLLCPSQRWLPSDFPVSLEVTSSFWALSTNGDLLYEKYFVWCLWGVLEKELQWRFYELLLTLCDLVGTLIEEILRAKKIDEKFTKVAGLLRMRCLAVHYVTYNRYFHCCCFLIQVC